MAGYFVSGGEIPLRYFDRLKYERTFKVTAYGMSMKDIFDGLCQIVMPEDIYDMCKVDSNTFNFCMKDEESVDMINSVGKLRIRDKVFDIISISKQLVEFRVHWLPNYINDSFLEDYFSKYGKVTSVIREAVVFTPNDTKQTGVRRIMIETDEVRKRSLPYVISFNGGYTALITMPGRPPLCLKCRTIGHLRKDCIPNSTPKHSQPQTQSKESIKSYAEVVGTQERPENRVEDESQQPMESLDVATGSTIPPNQPKRGLENTDDGDDEHGEGGFMIDDDREEEYLTIGRGGKKVKNCP